MAFGFSSQTTCSVLDSDDDCNGCGWKCNCVSCSTNGGDPSTDCHCSCRFWIVVCFVVALGFLGVFFTSVLYKRPLLSFMSSMAVLAASSLAALSILTDECVWPAFFAVTLVFAFPCFYSCCWNYHTRRNDGPTTSGQPNSNPLNDIDRDANRAKPTPAVLIQLPGGEVQIGMEVEMVKLDNEIPSSRGVDDPGAASSSSLSIHSSSQIVQH